MSADIGCDRSLCHIVYRECKVSIEREEDQMSLVTILPVAVFVVVACIAFYSGRKKLRQQGNAIPWYKQAYISMGLTSLLLALFFLLIGVHDMLPEQNTGARLLVFIVAGIVFVGAGVSCWYMVRYYPFIVRKDEN
jgi:hypothetical protein